ncbi:MAG: O-antigen ligase family protein [Myxococcales bacterium]|nr:O-antigen ligase family protein [Myxococcales bacterium]
MLAWCPWFQSGVLLPKRMALHALAVITLAMVARPIERRRTILAVLASAAIVAACLTSDVCASTLPRSLDLLAGLWLVIAIGATRLRTSVIAATFVGSACVAALIGLVEQWVALPWLLEATRPASVFGGRNAAGEFIAAVIPMAALIPRGSWIRGPVRPVALALLSAFLVTTRCRAAWVGALLGLTTSMLGLKRHRRWVVLASVLLAIGAAIALTPGPRMQWKAQSPYRQSLVSIGLGALDNRLTTWANTLKFIEAHPVLGVGPGRFRSTYPEFSHAVAPDPFFRVSVQIEEPHNELLRLLVEIGILGAVLLVAAVWPRWPKRRPGARRLMLVGSLVALLPAALVSVTFVSPPALLVAAVCLGLLLRAPSSSGVRPWAFRALAMLFLLGAGVVDVASVQSSRAMLAGSKALAAGHLRSAGQHFAHAARWSVDPSAWVRLAETAAQAGDVRACLRAAEQALEREPLSLQTLHLRGACSAMARDRRAAITAYERALSILPTDYIALVGLAELVEEPRRTALALAAQSIAAKELAELPEGSHRLKASDALERAHSILGSSAHLSLSQH